MVDLSKLRLRPWAVRCDRGDYPFDLHAGIRGPPAALRLAARQASGALETAPVRIRAAQSDLYAAVEAGSDRTGARRPRLGLGRSADADDRWPATAPRSTGGQSPFRQPYPGRQSQ